MPSRANAEVPVALLFRGLAPRIAALVGLQVVGSLAGLVPLLAVAELARSLGRPGPVDVGQVRMIVIVGACGLVVRLALTGAATALGHTVDGEAQLALRLRLASHLATAPLAWLARRRSGELSKVVGADVSAMHPVIAHTPAELATAFVVPAASLVDLFAIDPPAWPRAASAPSETTPQCACGPRLYSSTCPTRPPRPTTNPMPVIHQPAAAPRNPRVTPMAITSGHQLHGEK